MQSLQLLLVAVLHLFGPSEVSPFTMSSSPETGGGASSGSPFIKCCVVEIKPERVEEFSNLCKISQTKSTRDEPGCLRLDILRIADGSTNKFIVYEIFTDEKAYEHHGKQPYSHDIGAFIQSGGVAHEDAYVAEKLFMTE